MTPPNPTNSTCGPNTNFYDQWNPDTGTFEAPVAAINPLTGKEPRPSMVDCYEATAQSFTINSNEQLAITDLQVKLQGEKKAIQLEKALLNRIGNPDAIYKIYDTWRHGKDQISPDINLTSVNINSQSNNNKGLAQMLSNVEGKNLFDTKIGQVYWAAEVNRKLKSTSLGKVSVHILNNVIIPQVKPLGVLYKKIENNIKQRESNIAIISKRIEELNKKSAEAAKKPNRPNSEISISETGLSSHYDRWDYENHRFYEPISGFSGGKQVGQHQPKDTQSHPYQPATPIKFSKEGSYTTKLEEVRGALKEAQANLEMERALLKRIGDPDKINSILIDNPSITLADFSKEVTSRTGVDDSNNLLVLAHQDRIIDKSLSVSVRRNSSQFKNVEFLTARADQLKKSIIQREKNILECHKKETELVKEYSKKATELYTQEADTNGEAIPQNDTGLRGSPSTPAAFGADGKLPGRSFQAAHAIRPNEARKSFPPLTREIAVQRLEKLPGELAKAKQTVQELKAKLKDAATKYDVTLDLLDKARKEYALHPEKLLKKDIPTLEQKLKRADAEHATLSKKLKTAQLKQTDLSYSTSKGIGKELARISTTSAQYLARLKEVGDWEIIQKKITDVEVKRAIANSKNSGEVFSLDLGDQAGTLLGNALIALDREESLSRQAAIQAIKSAKPETSYNPYLNASEETVARLKTTIASLKRESLSLSAALENLHHNRRELSARLVITSQAEKNYLANNPTNKLPTHDQLALAPAPQGGVSSIKSLDSSSSALKLYESALLEFDPVFNSYQKLLQDFTSHREIDPKKFLEVNQQYRDHLKKLDRFYSQIPQDYKKDVMKTPSELRNDLNLKKVEADAYTFVLMNNPKEEIKSLDELPSYTQVALILADQYFLNAVSYEKALKEIWEPAKNAFLIYVIDRSKGAPYDQPKDEAFKNAFKQMEKIYAQISYRDAVKVGFDKSPSSLLKEVTSNESYKILEERREEKRKL